MASPKPPAPESSATECPNPRPAGLDRLSIEEIVGLLLDEDAGVSEAVRRARPSIEAGTALLVEVLGNGGRWINLGAGTSGRIGVLDAAEIPPTFGLEPSRVQAVLAGGSAALERAVEGAEDDPDAGARALRERELASVDAVVALSAGVLLIIVARRLDIPAIVLLLIGGAVWVLRRRKRARHRLNRTFAENTRCACLTHKTPCAF